MKEKSYKEMFSQAWKRLLHKAADYNQMMKDIPIKELLDLTDLVLTHSSLQNILTALKKLKGTQYPVKRAVSFISIISADLNT